MDKKDNKIIVYVWYFNEKKLIFLKWMNIINIYWYLIIYKLGILILKSIEKYLIIIFCSLMYLKYRLCNEYYSIWMVYKFRLIGK